MKKTIEEIKEKYALKFMKIPGVEGVGITQEKEEKVIVIFCSRNPQLLKGRIPEKLEGYKVKLKFTGEFQAF